MIGSITEPQPAYYVEDNGIGFDMAHADKLFKVFECLHQRDQGSRMGIGLAMAARIVQRHGGCMWAEGHPGQGATFYFTLPGVGRAAAATDDSAGAM